MAIEKVEIKRTQSRANLYHVPLKQWKRWDAGARQVFNEVYSSMRLFLHPKQDSPSRSHWKTTCWNAAWIAASAAKDAQCQ